MIFRWIFTSILILLCHSLIVGQDPQKFDAREAVRYGLNNHSRISNERKNLEYREWLTKKEKSNYLPSVNASADYRYNTNLPVTILPAEAFGQQSDGPLEIQMGTRNSLQGGINLEQDVYNSVIHSRINEKEIQKNMAEVNIAAIRKTVALDIKRSYYQAVLNYEVWQASKDILQNYENLEAAVKVKFENGLISENDLNQLIKKRQNQSEEIKINRMEFKNSLKRLKMSMDYPAGKELTIADSLVISLVSDVTIPKSDSFAYRRLPEYRDISLQESLNEARISTLDKRYHPRIQAYGYFGAQYYDDTFQPFQNDNRWYRHSYLGLKFQLPLFKGLERSHQKQALKIRSEILSQKRTKLASDLQRRENILKENIIIKSKQAVKKKNDYRFSYDSFTDMINNFENGLTDFENVLHSEIEMMVQFQAYLNSMVNVLNVYLDYEKTITVY